jgi:MFS family permease
LCSAYFLEGAGYIVTGTFLPAIVDSLPGLGDLGTGTWILVGLAAAPSALLWAGAASRLGAATALGVAYAAQAAGILLPAVSSAWWAAAASGTLFGGTFVGISALTLTYARQFVDVRRAGLAIGLLTAAYGAGQVVGPLVAARLADDVDHFGPALVAASAAVALGVLLIAGVWFIDATPTTKESAYGDEH